MRSTTCTSLVLALAAFPAGAEPPHGCFARDYDAAHLAANPAQIVARMQLDMHEALATEGMSLLPGQTVAYLSVTLADQGHVARTPAPDEGYPDGFGGAEMSGALACDEQGGVTECSIECDGGAFTITRNDGAVLAITTSYLMVGMGQDCGGFTDLAEQPNTPVTYLLHRVDDAVCAQN